MPVKPLPYRRLRRPAGIHFHLELAVLLQVILIYRAPSSVCLTLFFCPCVARRYMKQRAVRHEPNPVVQPSMILIRKIPGNWDSRYVQYPHNVKE